MFEWSIIERSSTKLKFDTSHERTQAEHGVVPVGFAYLRAEEAVYAQNK